MVIDDRGGAMSTALFAIFVTAAIGLLLILNAKFIKSAKIAQKQIIIHDVNFLGQLKILEEELANNEEFPLRILTSSTANGQKIERILHPFGLFVLFHLKFKAPGKTHEHYGIVINKQPPVGDKQTALVHLGINRSLAVVGKSSISGDIYVSKKGIRPGNYNGTEYSEQIPKNGSLITLDKQFHIDIDLLDSTISDCKSKLIDFTELSILSYSGKLELEGNTVSLSELIDYQIHNISGPGYLVWDMLLPYGYKLSLTNFIRIIGREKINLNAYSRSSYCLFYSTQKIEIAGQHQSQFISSKITSISDTLYYPTVLSSIPGLIPEFEINSYVRGTIFQFPSREDFPANRNQLIWKNRATVDGLVLTFFSMDPNIKINGSLFIRETYFYESPTHFRNWLKDTKITSGSEYSLFPFTRATKNNPVVIYAN